MDHLGVWTSTSKPSRGGGPRQGNDLHGSTVNSVLQRAWIHNRILFGQLDAELKGPSVCPAPEHPQSRVNTVCDMCQWWQLVLVEGPRMQHRHQGCHPCAHRWQIPVWLPGRKAKGTAEHWPRSCGRGGYECIWEDPGTSCKVASRNAPPALCLMDLRAATSHTWERGLPCSSRSAAVQQCLVCCTELWG